LDHGDETQPGPQASDPILKPKSDTDPQAFPLSLEREVRQEFGRMVEELLHAKEIVSKRVEIAKGNFAAFRMNPSKQHIILGQSVFHFLEFTMMYWQELRDR
jgi:hypothetical protein